MAMRMRRTTTSPFFLLVVVALPLHDGSGWHRVGFPNRPITGALFSKGALTLQVRSSSSPLCFVLKEPLRVSRVEVTGSVSGFPRLGAGKTEADKGNDDFPLRLGLVEEGDGGPRWVERLFAPLWLRELVAEAPAMRFRQVHFLALSHRLPVGHYRGHPMSRYIDEEVVARQEEPGPFRIDYSVAPPRSVFAVWLHADGDDTKSSFDVSLTSLSLTGDSPRAVNGQ